MKDNNCVFCKIISKDVPADIIYQDQTVTAFWDKHPVAPVHILIVPNHHIDSVNQIQEENEQTIGHLFTIAKQIARQQEIDQAGYRLVVNTGPNAGQSVFHLHLHLLGGKFMPSSFQ